MIFDFRSSSMSPMPASFASLRHNGGGGDAAGREGKYRETSVENLVSYPSIVYGFRIRISSCIIQLQCMEESILTFFSSPEAGIFRYRSDDIRSVFSETSPFVVERSNLSLVFRRCSCACFEILQTRRRFSSRRLCRPNSPWNFPFSPRLLINIKKK